MILPCPTRSLCVDPSTPFANFSAELPDQEIFIGINTGYGPSYPPLGSDFIAVGCTAFCESTVSQEDADLCAAQNNTGCTSVIFPVGQVVPDVFGKPAVLYSPRPIFRSTQQQATVNCPDGNPFVYTLAAGRFSAFNQATADAMALSYAQEQASNFLVCLSDLSNPRVCSGAPYMDSITASGNFISQAPPGDVWQIVSGALPPGITVAEFIFTSGLVVGGTIHLSGTCSIPGVYPFTIQITDTMGDTMTKQFSITVAGIDNGFALEDGMAGTAYSQNVTSAGVTNPIYSLEDGALPDGLSLDPGGIIFGTPTKVDVFDFTLGVTEAGTGVTCNAPAQIVVTSDFNWNDQTVGVFNNDGGYVPNIISGSHVQIDGSAAPGNFVSNCTLNTQNNPNFTLTYEGPPTTGTITVKWKSAQPNHDPTLYQWQVTYYDNADPTVDPPTNTFGSAALGFGNPDMFSLTGQWTFPITITGGPGGTVSSGFVINEQVGEAFPPGTILLDVTLEPNF